MMNSKTSKLIYGLTNISESLIDQITVYCLTLELDFTKWAIGTSSKLEVFDNEKGKGWECQTNLEVKEVKKYFIENKKMDNADGDDIKGRFIYVKQKI